VCKEVDGLCLKLHYCTPGLVRTSAESTPYKGATSPIPLEPLLLLLLLLLLLFHCTDNSIKSFQINQPTRRKKFSSLLLDLYTYVQLNRCRAYLRPSSGAQQLQQPLLSSAVGRGRAGYARPRPTALLPPRSKGKTIGCYCSC
jgi:hypothetical protein